MDRRQALAGPELRTLQSPAAPWLALRRGRLPDLADSPDTQSAPVAGWRKHLAAVPPAIRPQAALLAARPLFSSRLENGRTSISSILGMGLTRIRPNYCAFEDLILDPIRLSFIESGTRSMDWLLPRHPVFRLIRFRALRVLLRWLF